MTPMTDAASLGPSSCGEKAERSAGTRREREEAALLEVQGRARSKARAEAEAATRAREEAAEAARQRLAVEPLAVRDISSTSDFSKWRVPDLRAACAALCLDDTGLKAVLVRRLANHYLKATAPQGPVVAEAIAAVLRDATLLDAPCVLSPHPPDAPSAPAPTPTTP